MLPLVNPQKMKLLKMTRKTFLKISKANDRISRTMIRIKGVRDQPPKLSDITLVLIPSTQKRMMIDVKEYQITL